MSVHDELIDEHMKENERLHQEDLDLSDDEGHAGDDWDTLLKETGADEGEGGELLPETGPDADPDAAGYRDILIIAFNTTSHVFGLGLTGGEVGELARAWGRVADHYLPDCPTQASPLADALFTTGTIAAPRVVAALMSGPEEEEGAETGPEQGQPKAEQPRPATVVKLRPDDPNAWTKKKETEW